MVTCEIQVYNYDLSQWNTATGQDELDRKATNNVPRLLFSAAASDVDGGGAARMSQVVTDAITK